MVSQIHQWPGLHYLLGEPYHNILNAYSIFT
ncbi:hypothetical protein NOC27_781 [Nitrosococcus oceani AFC27]|nr:hypothetical protein NOC27_781 [Nitrosococcus oceani AFC27]